MSSSENVLQPKTKSRFWWEEKSLSNIGETLDLDQIEGAEFEFLGPEIRFERNKTKRILKFETKVWSPKSKFWAGQTLSNCQKLILRNF